MKTKKLLFLFISLMLGLFISPVFADVTKTVGSTGADFATFKDAFDAVNANTGGEYIGVVSLQVVDDVTETEAILTTANTNWTSLKIYPVVTGKTISYAGTSQAIELQGADKVTIDGRLHNSSGELTGELADLTLTSETGVIAFTNDASNNIVIYCYLKGKRHPTAGQLINFASALTVGNNYNTISYNNITTPDGTAYTSRPFTVVRFDTANGDIGSDHNTISNNNIYNFFRADGITIAANNDYNNISGNSLYETSTDIYQPLTNSTVIRNSGATGTVISGNFIGGSGPECTGTWANIKPVSTASSLHFFGINIGSSSTDVTIDGNTIKNFDWRTNNSGNLFRAIQIDQTVVSLDLKNNVIGDIIVSNSGAGQAWGIYFNVIPSSASYISKNFIYNINYNVPVGGGTVYGIQVNKGPITCSNNIVSLGGDYQNTVYGIQNKADNASYDNNFYFNTVYIGGVPSTGANISYALYSNNNLGTSDYRNNIFVNGRSNGGTATGQHYAVYFNYSTSANLTCDYNNYYVSGTGGMFGSYATVDRTSLSTWQSATGTDVNSTERNPVFVSSSNPSAFEATGNLYGVAGTGVTIDFNGDTRSEVYVQMGAFKSPKLGTSMISTNKENDKTTVLINETGIVVPLEKESDIELYSMNGVQLDKTKATGTYVRNLDKGLYIIKVNSVAIKFVK